MSAAPHDDPPPDRLAALTRVSALLRSGVPARETMQAVLAAMPEIIPADAYAIWRYQHRAEEWQIVASAGLSPAYVSHTIRERYDARVLLDVPFEVPDVFAWPQVDERKAFYEAEGIRALLVLPLHLRDEPAGTLACYFRTPRPIDVEERQIAQILADVVSAALNVRKFDRFAEAARVASAELDLHRVVQTVTDAATELTNAQFGAFFYNVINEAGESYTLYSISGVPREAFARFPMPRNTAVFEPTFSGSAIVRSANIREDPRYGHNAPFHGMPEGHLPVVSYLAVPVISRSGEVLGGLFFGHSEEGVFTETEEQVVVALAAHASVAIDNARLYEALQRERARLQHSESRYRALVMAAGTRQALWTASPDGRVAEDLAGWRELTGHTVDEMRDQDWLHSLHPADRERVSKEWQRAIELRVPYQEQFRLRSADGSYRWYAATAVPVLRADGTLLEWVGTTVDIHDRKSAEDSLRFLAEAGELLFSSLDYETTLRTVAQLAVPSIADWCTVDIVDENGEQQRLAVAHVDPAKIALAHDLRRRYPPDPETDAVTRVIRTGRSEWMAIIPRELLDQSARDDEHRLIIHELGLTSYIAVPLRAHGRTFGALTFVLSERRYSEGDVAIAEELGRRAGIAIVNARLYSDAQAANRAKDDFLATLSHELRTPMTAVLGWARMLRIGLSPEESVEAVNAIERSATVQMQLIEDILDMSRIMAGKLRLDSKPVDLCATVEAALDTVRPTAVAKQIEIVTDYPRNAPMVAGDESRLHQIVWNLLTNALKFTNPGGRVAVRVTGTDQVVGLQVRDTGVGIDPGFLPHVFERFRQQDSSTTRSHGGIGLGLAIVRHLVELHGGRIYAESEGRGRGATFTVELPPLHVRGPRRRQEDLHDYLPSLEGMRVLVVDDEAMTRDVVAAMLRRAGANVATADSARAAHDMLPRVRPDVIVCDIAMPGEDGYAFLRELRAREPELAQTRVVALTAFGRPEDREKALDSGFDAYLKKPVDPALLATTLRR